MADSGAPIVAEEVPIGVDPSHDHVKSINKISRFPVSMREFCEERNYIVPEAVAIGPYYHGKEKLREMEEVKEAAARFLFKEKLQEKQRNVFRIALSARSWYDTNALQGIRDDTFASMMFHDACFLLLTIISITEPIKCDSSLLRKIVANINVLLRDIFLLENQIPWIVLEALMDIQQVGKFIAKMGSNVQSYLYRSARPLHLGDYKPPHLLGLFHFYQSGHKFTYAMPTNYTTLESLPLGTSAIELAEIGIKLTRSKTTELDSVDLANGILFPKLFLPSLRLNEKTTCWLLNMAAFETCTASHDCTVSSYLALFAMLMDREEDVHELRSKHLIHGEFTNKQVLDFFKGRQASNICPGSDFNEILKRLERYIQKRPLIWITIYRFFYKNKKTILMVLSVASILAAILKA